MKKAWGERFLPETTLFDAIGAKYKMQHLRKNDNEMLQLTADDTTSVEYVLERTNGGLF